MFDEWAIYYLLAHSVIHLINMHQSHTKFQALFHTLELQHHKLIFKWGQRENKPISNILKIYNTLEDSSHNIFLNVL